MVGRLDGWAVATETWTVGARAGRYNANALTYVRTLGPTVALGSVTKTGDTICNNDDLDDAIFVRSVFCSFVRFFVRSKKFQKIGRVAAMILVQKSSKSELSSRFFGRLKIKKRFPFLFS